MNELSALMQSAPWLVIGGALVALNLILFVLKITKRLLLLAIGAVLVAVGIYTGVIETPDALLALPMLYLG